MGAPGVSKQFAAEGGFHSQALRDDEEMTVCRYRVIRNPSMETSECWILKRSLQLVLEIQNCICGTARHRVGHDPAIGIVLRSGGTACLSEAIQFD